MQNRRMIDPLSGIPLREMLDQLFADAVLPSRLRGTRSTEGTLTPPVNMYETDSDLMVVVPLPGMSPNDIDVELLGTRLTIRTHARRDVPHADAGPRGGSPDSQANTGARGNASPGDDGSQDVGHRYHLHEFQIGPHERILELPREVDGDRVQSTYEHGLLSLRFPCRQADRPRRITLQPS
jgi:HSP20 family protein